VSNFILDGQLWEATKDLPLFGGRLKTYIMQEGKSPPSGRQLAVLDSANELPGAILADIANLAIAYYRRIDPAVNCAAEGTVIDVDNIENNYQFCSISIPEMRDCDSNILFISADCDWEVEHGMQVVVLDGRVVYCGEPTSLPFSRRWQSVLDAPAEKRDETLKLCLM